jgi:hypothetical protein
MNSPPSLKMNTREFPYHSAQKERIKSMDASFKEQLAAFRYSLIAPIVSRQTPLATGELKAYLERTAQQTYHIPGSTKTQVSLRSLERYLSQYRKGEWEALKPKGRSTKANSRIPACCIARSHSTPPGTT